MTDTMNDAPPTFGITRSPELNELATALAKAQMAMEGARKDKTNPHFKSAYADIAAVWDAIREPLANNGLCVMQWPRTVNNGVEIETILVHSSGQFISDTLAMPAKMDAHGIGSAITYGRRYALMAVAGVAPVDDDGNGAADRSGVPGSAGGGTQFRPDGPRRIMHGSPAGAATADAEQRPIDEPRRSGGWVGEAERDGLLDPARPKGTLPEKPGAKPTPAANAIKRVEWVKASIEGFKLMQNKADLTEWWKAEAERLQVIEDAMPNEYERLLAAYDFAIERTAVKAA